MEDSLFDFKKHEAEIRQRVGEKLQALGITEPGGFSLIPGFIATTVNPVLLKNMNITGPALPMVVLIGNQSGRVHFFSLAVLFPEVLGNAT